jgi:hypothetical protein
MSKRITLDLSNEVYAGLEQRAAHRGLSLDDLLLEHLQHLASEMPSPELVEGEAPPAFWDLPDIDAEIAALEVEVANLQAVALDPDAARSATDTMLQRWFGGRMSEAEALELAMADDIHEWNLDL